MTNTNRLIISDSNLVYYLVGESRHSRLSQSAVETFFKLHRVAITSVTVVEWIASHANDLPGIQKLLGRLDLTAAPMPIHGLRVDVTALQRILAAKQLTEVQPEIDDIVELRLQAEADLLRFTLLFLVLAFQVGVAETRLSDQDRQRTVIAAMAASLEANVEFVKDELAAVLRRFYKDECKLSEVRSTFCIVVASLAYASLVNFHCSINGVKLAPDMDVSLIKTDKILQQLAKADNPADILRAISPKEVRRATPDYLSGLRSVLGMFGVSHETLGHWCSRLSKALMNRTIPDKNDMMDMLILDTVSQSQDAVLVTADGPMCDMLKEYHPASYAFIQNALADAIPPRP
jgi:hypothetical protein